MFGSGSISRYPDIAKRQLWDWLPGTYKVTRWDHHDMVIKGQKYTQNDIVLPSWGVSKIFYRVPEDPAYEFELLQLTGVHLVTKKCGPRVPVTEHRFFRCQNGEWSLWKHPTDSMGTVLEKITDLTLAYAIDTPHVRAAQQPWEDKSGLNHYLGLKFYMTEEPYWTMYHRKEWKAGGMTLQGDEYEKMPVDWRGEMLDQLAREMLDSLAEVGKEWAVGLGHYFGVLAWP